jgi:hypothetical protein
LQNAFGSFFSVREADNEFGLALLRDRLRDPFGGFSAGVLAEFLRMSARTTQSSKLSSGTT